MLSKRHYDDPTPDPLDQTILKGKCSTCSTEIECRRGDLAIPRQRRYGSVLKENEAWPDLASCECPKCGAKIYPTLKGPSGGSAGNG